MTVSSDHKTLGSILTETRNPRTRELDALSTPDMLRAMNAEDATVAACVAAEIPNIARAIDSIAERMANGGRLFYIGAGTSGRLGVLDASEIPPTFSAPRDLVQGIIAGGDPAIRVSAESAEDDRNRGAQDLVANGFNQSRGMDTLVGIAASGRTPYVLGAMEFARAEGCLTIGLSCVPGSAVAQAAQIAITPATGPEVITGSTRMKAGTATKLVLNMLSTAVMAKLGYVYGNLMTNVQPTNEKLVDRAERIIAEATGCTPHRAAELLREAHTVRCAILMELRGISRDEAEARLAASGQHLRRALEQ